MVGFLLVFVFILVVCQVLICFVLDWFLVCYVAFVLVFVFLSIAGVFALRLRVLC